MDGLPSRAEIYVEYKAAKDAFRACPGCKIEDLQERIHFAFYTFSVNWRELDGWFQSAASDQGKAAAIISFFDPAKRLQFLRELERRLHNYCASVKSLVDHTRRVHVAMDSYRDISTEVAELNATYFKNHGLSQFVQQLRNYFVHLHPVSSGYSIQCEGGEFTVPYRFRKALLLEYGEWNKSAKRFLEEAGDQIDVQTTLESYFQYTKAFYDILWAKHREWFAPQFAERQRLLLTVVELEKKLEEKDKAEALPRGTFARRAQTWRRRRDSNPR